MFHNKTNLAAPNDYDNDYDDDGQFRYDNILGDTRWSFIFTSSLSRLAKKLRGLSCMHWCSRSMFLLSGRIKRYKI